MPRDPPGSAAGSVQGEGSLDVPAHNTAPQPGPQIGGRRWMDGWMNGRERRQSKYASERMEFRLVIYIL